MFDTLPYLIKVLRRVGWEACRGLDTPQKPQIRLKEGLNKSIWYPQGFL